MTDLNDDQQHVYSVLHLFSGLGGAALGFQAAEVEHRGVRGQFHTLAGIDCDPEACQDFEALTQARAVQLDLFGREDYAAYHGHEPPAEWREATAQDLREATGGLAPDVVFLSAPCKGFSGLLPAAKAGSAKYQALNHLVPRGLRLTLEAFADDLPAIILLENVPRITTRGAGLLVEVKGLLGARGYVFAEGYHDCGELGGLGQRRRRYLLIARLPARCKADVREPMKQSLRTIGDVIGPMAMPDDPGCGRLHRLPRLTWRTWVRLALIPAGGDWRDLAKSGREWFHGAYGIVPWDKPCGTVTSGGAPSCHPACVADPRLGYKPRKGAYKIGRFDEPATAIVGAANVRGSNCMAAIADPRGLGGHLSKYRVRDWDKPAGTVTGDQQVGSGGPSVADPRIPFNNVWRVTRFDEPSGAVTAGGGPSSSGVCVADPRLPEAEGRFSGKYQVVAFDQSAPCVTGTPDVQAGAVSVADPRLGCKARNGTMGVQDWTRPAYTVAGTADIHAGTAAVADPRLPAAGDRPDPPPLIIALDGTWHRPLTTLELAALQGLPLQMPDGRPLTLAGNADGRWRERIGNAVPPPAARAIAEEVLKAFLLSAANEWTLGNTHIWVGPLVEMPVAD